MFTLHEVEIGVAIAAGQSHPRDEVVEDEVVQNDDAGALAEGIDDPGMRIRIVPDVVQRHVGPA